MSITEYGFGVRPLIAPQMRLVEANIAAGNAVSMCYCGTVILALERKQIKVAHANHLQAIRNIEHDL